MPTLGIRLVVAGNNSGPGHMYVVFKGDDGSVTTFGFYPASPADAVYGFGRVLENEDFRLHEGQQGAPGTNGVPNVSLDFPLSQSDFQRALDFATDAESQAGRPNTQWGVYHPIYNSCIDFTWNVMQQAGLTKANWFEGWPVPAWNEKIVKDIYFDYFRRPEFNRELRRVTANTSPTFRLELIDPLAIDLNGDGIETVAANGYSGALFDADADGIRTASGWLKGDDGWLVRDLNGNGVIDSGREMFGDQSMFASGQKAGSGIAALAALDANADGKLDAADAAFGELRIWQDANGEMDLGPRTNG